MRDAEESLRGLEREIAATLASGFVPYGLARRYGDECRRRGLEWTPFLDVTLRDAVRAYLKQSDDGNRRAAHWVRLVDDALLSARPTIEAAISAVNTALMARRLRVKPDDVYFLLMPYWDHVAAPQAADTVATWATGSDDRASSFMRDGTVAPQSGAPRMRWPTRRGRHPWVWTALGNEESVIVGFGLMNGMGNASDVPLPVVESGSLPVYEAWSAGRPALRTTAAGWAPLSRMEIPLGQAVHFVLDQELRDTHPEVFEGLPLQEQPETLAQVEEVLSSILAAANGRRILTALGMGDLREAVCLALACRDPFCVVASVANHGPAAHAIMAPGHDGRPETFDEKTPSSFRSVMGSISDSLPRRSRGGTRITIGLVTADEQGVTIGVTAATGRVLGWSAPGAVMIAWGMPSLRVDEVRRWALMPSPDRVRLSREIAEEWSK